MHKAVMHKYEMTMYYSDEDSVFVVNVPERPGVMAHGDTASDEVKNAQDAICLRLDTEKELISPLPEPKGRRLVYAYMKGEIVNVI